MSHITENPTAENLSRAFLSPHFKKVRFFTEYLTETLEIEDFVIQPMENASPVKWHLAHTSWFFETFVLKKYQPGFESLHPQYAYLFNSYYLRTGVPFTRAKRGILSRPTVREVLQYRMYVNEQMSEFMDSCSEDIWAQAAPVIEIGINHEQQHQELILTDVKYTLAQNPLMPVFRARELSETPAPEPLKWISFDEEVIEIGFGETGFSYDNEHPRHRALVPEGSMANRLITNAEYMEFMNDNGYGRTELWLSEGWAAIQSEGWKAPLYWFTREGEWWQFTLSGSRPVDPHEPVTHISYFEADAFARWMDARLPTEQEWERAASRYEIKGNFVEQETFHPVPLSLPEAGVQQLFGDAWEWTLSSYAPYPGYKPLPGALGEYNGKFMSNQYVLRGGSCATSNSHIRSTYRNFFQADSRWQFSAIRLVK